MIKNTASLGLLTTGSRTVKFYQQQIEAIMDQAVQSNASPTLKLIPSDFSITNQYLPNQFSYLEPIVQKDLDVAIKEKTDSLIIPNITLHETIDRLREKNLIPPTLKIVHPLNSSLNALRKKNVAKIIILGSTYTSHCSWIHDYFSLNGIETTSINEEHTLHIDKIRQKTYCGDETQKDYRDYNSLINYYKQQASVLIACTELSILINEKDIIDNVFDMARIQIQEAAFTY